MAKTLNQGQVHVHPRSAWYRQLGFGMFIHWGPYSALGHGEWALHDERIPLAEYDEIARNFTARNYDPRNWVRLAKEAGMKYLVLTARHCDGYCLWDSKAEERNAVRGTPGRDLIKEFVAACREGGMGVGFYYSLWNWYQEYQTFQGFASAGWNPDNSPEVNEKLKPIVDRAHAEIRELLTGYGPIDILWFDCELPSDPQVSRIDELFQMIRTLQPDCLVSNRGSGYGDFATPEQQIESDQGGRPWETCMTIADRWGYSMGDTNYKSTVQLLRTLRMCAIQGGNFLLNVGPYADGTIPYEQARRLREIGEWLRVHGQSFFGARFYPAGHCEWGGYCSFDGEFLYLPIDRWCGREFVCVGLQNRILSARLLTTGQELRFDQVTPYRAIFHDLPEQPPDPRGAVIACKIEGEPKFVPLLPIK
jgi:alpha-L-fucosidase